MKGVHHTTLINSVKQVGKLLPDAYDPEVIAQVAELDELQTYVKKHTQNLAVDSSRPLSVRNFRIGIRRP
jgi:hypothetical protein